MLEHPKIAEIYGPVIQGEGPGLGAPTVFVRTGGCDYRCSWCDTDHAVQPGYRDQWKPMTAAQIVERVREIMPAPGLVTLSGGNPAIQPLAETVGKLAALGYETAIETQGSVAPAWLSRLSRVVLSPKPPSSGHEIADASIYAVLQAAGQVQVNAKIVIADPVDLEWALEWWSRWRERLDGPLYLQPMNPDFRPHQEPGLETLRRAYEGLCRQVMARTTSADIRIVPQLHVWVWGGGAGV